MVTKGEAKERIKHIQEKFLSISKEELDSMPEEQIKYRFIEPLFEALGWEKEDIEKEPRVLKGRADYILKITNQNKLVIEAKKTNIRLSEIEGRQSVSYAYHKNIKFAVLTNFKQIRVYHALSNIKHIDNNLLKDDKGLLWIDCENFIKEFDRLWILSRENFENEEIDKLLKNVDKKLIKPIDKTVLKDLLQFREWLCKDLKNKRTYLTQEQIDEIVQILIDRLIFMRSVEDRGLEEKDFLLNKIRDVSLGKTDKNLWALLKIQFRIFNKEYDSILFSEGLLEKEGFFDEGTLKKVIKGFYYGTQDHQERYMFDEIPLDLLGNIYEQYLGTILRGTEKRVRLELGSGKRKKMGIYYTPSYIVDYIVKNTVGEYIKNRTIDEILDVKILDPACGSGSFLTRAFQEICNVIENKLKKKEKSGNPAFKNYKGRLNLAQKMTILTHCIYGVDLDEKAVELARLSLLLKLLEEETRETRRQLPLMTENIKNGNSLIDDPKVAGDKAFNWKAQFSFKFDVVIGNPPYVDIKRMPSEQVKKLFEDYKTTENRINLYSIFIEKAINLLKDGGFFGFINPNSILFNSSYTKMRKLLLKEVNLKKIIRMPDNVFEEAKVETIVLIFKKKDSLQETDTDILIYGRESKINEISKGTAKIFLTTKQSKWEQNENFIFNIFANEETQTLLKKIKNHSIPLIELTDFSLGITPYDKYKGHSQKLIKNKGFHANYKKDKTYKKLLSGADIVRYGISWNGKNWIKYGACLGAPREKKFFTEPHIVVRQIVSGKPLRIYVGYTEEALVNAQIGFNILTKDESKFKIKYLLALLNSKLMNFYHTEKFLDKSKNLFQKILIQNAKKFPIKLPTQKQEKKIIELVNQMLSLQKKFHNEKIAGREKEMLEQQIKNVDYEIDQEVYKLYGITDKEKEIIEKS